MLCPLVRAPPRAAWSAFGLPARRNKIDYRSTAAAQNRGSPSAQGAEGTGTTKRASARGTTSNTQGPKTRRGRCGGAAPAARVPHRAPPARPPTLRRCGAAAGRARAPYYARFMKGPVLSWLVRVFSSRAGAAGADGRRGSTPAAPAAAVLSCTARGGRRPCHTARRTASPHLCFSISSRSWSTLAPVMSATCGRRRAQRSRLLSAGAAPQPCAAARRQLAEALLRLRYAAGASVPLSSRHRPSPKGQPPARPGSSPQPRPPARPHLLAAPVEVEGGRHLDAQLHAQLLVLLVALKLDKLHARGRILLRHRAQRGVAARERRGAERGPAGSDSEQLGTAPARCRPAIIIQGQEGACHLLSIGNQRRPCWRRPWQPQTSAPARPGRTHIILQGPHQAVKKSTTTSLSPAASSVG